MLLPCAHVCACQCTRVLDACVYKGFYFLGLRSDVVLAGVLRDHVRSRQLWEQVWMQPGQIEKGVTSHHILGWSAPLMATVFPQCLPRRLYKTSCSMHVLSLSTCTFSMFLRGLIKGTCEAAMDQEKSVCVALFAPSAKHGQALGSDNSVHACLLIQHGVTYSYWSPETRGDAL